MWIFSEQIRSQKKGSDVSLLTSVSGPVLDVTEYLLISCEVLCAGELAV